VPKPYDPMHLVHIVQNLAAGSRDVTS
jgi:hypothetical protein